jgi:UDPglucose 6-dehydrogenase
MADLTERHQFRALDFTLVKKLMKTSIIIDLRNIYYPIELLNDGFTCQRIGRAQADRCNQRSPKVSTAP